PAPCFFDPERGYLTLPTSPDAEWSKRMRSEICCQYRMGQISASLHRYCVDCSWRGNYFQTTVGSLLQGLTEEERADIHLLLFITHTDPNAHPAYLEKWLSAAADTVLIYDLKAKEFEHIK